MFMHKKDSSEVEMKINDEGVFAVHCLKCNMVWVGTLINVPNIPTPTGISGIEERSPEFSRATRTKTAGRLARVGTLNSGMALEGSQKIIAAAEKAFPDFFK